MQPLEAKLLTVSIRPDELQLDMIWAGVYAFDDLRMWSQVTALIPEVR